MTDLNWEKAKRELEAKNYEHARVLLELLDHNNAAKLQLAYLYQIGLGGSADLVRAQKIYQVLADEGDSEGMYYLARLFLSLGQLSEAAHYFEMSSLLSHASGSFWAAELNNGYFGYPLDKQKYWLLIRRAASLGHIYAIRNLALDDMRDARNIFLKSKACLTYIMATIKGIAIAITDPHNLFIR